MISAQDVKKLRDLTGVGMMDCKKALEEAGGDFDAAIEQLRKKGQKVAAKREAKEAKEGLIVSATAEDGSTSLLVEVNCETDFVARTDDFRAFAEDVSALILARRPESLEALASLEINGQAVEQLVTDMAGKFGEKIEVRRFEIVESNGGFSIPYIHPGARLGVLVDVSGSPGAQETGRDVAMQVAAMNPVAVRREDVPAEIQEKELEIGREAARNEGKPEQILDRIAQGKLERYFKDHVLIEQPFVKDASVRVQDVLSQAGLEVNRFVRFALGD